MPTDLPVDVLDGILRGHFADPSLRCQSVERSAVGNGQEIWFVRTATDAGPREFVLRRTAAGGPLEWTDRNDEASVMNAMSRAGLPVPPVHIVRSEYSELERPYLIMDRSAGSPAAMAPRADRQAIARQIAAMLPRIHAVPPGGGEKLPTRTESVRQEIAKWRKRYLLDAPFPIPILIALLDDLEDRVPESAEPACALWGDPGYHNVLVEGTGITALLDWELSHVGHPLEDLAVAVWMETGRVPENVIVEAYENSAEQQVDRAQLGFFIALACISRSMMVLAGVRSYLAGRTSEPSTLALGMHLLLTNVYRAARLLGWPSGESEESGERSVQPDCGYNVSAQVSGEAAEGDPAGVLPTVGQTAAGLARYLRDRILPTVADPRLIRGIKTAIALAETDELRADCEANITRQRAALEADLRTHLSEAGAGHFDNLQKLLDAVRTDGHGDCVRRFLLADLGLQRHLIRPLDVLYGTKPD